MSLKRLRRGATVAAAGAVAALLAVPVGAAPAFAAGTDAAAAPAQLPPTVSADSLPTVQINGVVWKQIVVGNTVYVAGEFTSARPAGAAAGTSEVSRANLLAYDITTGNLINSWAPRVNGTAYGLAASSDGKKIYISGSFTQVNGTTQYRIAAVDATSGALVSGFRPAFDARVRSIAVVGDTVYAGGIFSKVGSTARSRLAAVNGTTGALLPWAPTADAEVLAMVVPSSKPELVVAGRFGLINGVASRGTGALDLTSGASLAWAVQEQVYDYGPSSAVYSLSTDGTAVFATGYNYGDYGNFENSFAAEADGGALRWLNSCLGDTYGSQPLGGVLYTAGHTHDCSTMGGLPDLAPRQYQWALAGTTAASGRNNPRNAYGWAEGTPANTQLHWTPTFDAGSYTGQGQSTWSVGGTDKYLLYGGEFSNVNGRGQQGLARFAVRTSAPGKEGPQGGTDLTPSATTTYPGQVRLSWRSAWDRDDAALTYELLRGSASTVVATATASSEWWDRPPLALADPSPLAGAQQYRVRVTDASGNSVTGNPVSATVSTADAGAYASAVKTDGATDYWRLGDRTGVVGTASIGEHDLKVDSSQTRGVAGATADGNTAMTFTGVTEIPFTTRFGPSYKAVVPAATTYTLDGPQTYTTETWIKTTTTTGGKIIGFGNSNRDYSSSYDRQVYMTNDGRLVAGVYNGSTATAASTRSYNDGQWHHVVSTLGASGLQLYVDGVRVARNGSATQAQPFNGYWRIGGDNLNGWPDRPTSSGFAGSIDDVAVYAAPLTSAQIRAHFTASGRTAAAPAQPTDASGAAVYGSGPEAFWRLQETNGTTLADSSPDGATPAELHGGVTLGAAGVPGITGSTGVTFDGVAGSGLSSPGPVAAPSTYSEELWFKTTSTRGGKLIGFGDRPSGYSASNDRHVWMDRDGTLHFGAWTGYQNHVDSTKSYNDGGWHHVVATQGAAGMALYVDGALVGTNAQTQAQQYTGYWRVGGDSGWGTTENGFFDGTIDDVAIYPSALTASDAAAHFRAAGGNTAPTAVFTPTATGLSLAVDASASTDADGTVASYAWSFGDGGTGTGVTTQHTYARPGTYVVGLTTTDDKGASTTSQQSVVVRDASVTVPADAYGKAVFTAGPDAYYRLDDAAGSTSAADASGLGNTGAVRGGVTTGAPGVPAVGAGKGVTFNGQVGSTVVDPQRLNGPTTYSLELWFSTTSTRGGKLVGFGDGDGTGYSGNYDRHVIMNSDGTLHFGTWTGQENRVDTSAAYNDGRWHHLVATQGPSGMVMYVDGASVGTNPQTSAQGYTGSWRIGGDSSWGPTQNGFFDGSVDEVAIYSKVLGASTVADHYAKASAAANQAPTAAFTSAATGLAGSFDASTSTDADGTVASYAWTFGDGATGTGVTASHTYAAAGTYQVALTVTDDKGATGTVTRAVTVAAPVVVNQAPTASFTSASTDLTASFDATASADGDGTVASYAWTFGDGATGTGVTASHTYAAAGTYPVTLVVTDDKGATGTLRNDVVVTAPVVANQAPSAAFTSTVTELRAAFDATASRDADGTVASYAWDFGDGTTGTGATAAHTYTTAGTYQVTLLVTDDKGATGTVTSPITASADVPPATTTVAADAFGRTTTGGWGTADTGGAWTTAGGASAFSTGAGTGRMVLAKPGSTLSAALSGVSATGTDLRATFAVDKAASGGGTYLTLQGRKVGSDDYRVTARQTAGGGVTLSLTKSVGGTATTLRAVTVPNLTAGAGQQLVVRLQTTGSGTTTLSAKAWLAGTAEPSAFQVTATDTAAGLQAAGGVGVVAYLSGSSTNAPTTVSVSDLLAVRA